jgi:hypothetical protein
MMQAIKPPTSTSSTTTTTPRFLIFYSSILPSTGKMWCPDCLDVQAIINATFSGTDTPEAIIYYVGQKQQWRADDNVARVEWKVSGVPTVVKVDGTSGEEISRVTEVEILVESKWRAFVDGQ